MGVLEVNNVSIRYLTGDFKDIGLKEYVMRRLKKNYHVHEFWADKDISFSLEKGDMLGIIGTNGAGKSTLLKAISGIMEPTKGSVKREGNVAALLELASGFDGDLTVKENAYLRGAMLGYTRKFMDETYEQIIAFAELQDFQDRPFKQLSSGMKSRLAFAIASLVQPDILILDEVLSVGDGAFKKKSEAKMREIIEGGATTILVSHSLDQVENLCNKVLWLEKGQQVAFGDTKILCGLYQKYLDRELSLDQVKKIWQQLNGHYEYLVVGSGLFGAIFAREMTNRGKTCLVIDRRSCTGGNVRCEKIEGITVHKYGAHIFRTSQEDIWNYVNQYAKFCPVTLETVNGCEYRGIPEGGYNCFVDRLLKGIDVVTDMDYEKLVNAFPAISEKVVYTGSIDEYFGYCFGRLEYQSLRFEEEILPQEDFQAQALTEYTDEQGAHVRVVEYKHFLKEKSPKTVVVKEHLEDGAQGKEPYYPIDNAKNRAMYQEYAELAEKHPNVIFGGRLGTYRNYSMDETVSAALEAVTRELARSLN